MINEALAFALFPLPSSAISRVMWSELPACPVPLSCHTEPKYSLCRFWQSSDGWAETAFVPVWVPSLKVRIWPKRASLICLTVFWKTQIWKTLNMLIGVSILNIFGFHWWLKVWNSGGKSGHSALIVIPWETISPGLQITFRPLVKASAAWITAARIHKSEWCLAFLQEKRILQSKAALIMLSITAAVYAGLAVLPLTVTGERLTFRQFKVNWCTS